MVIIGAKGFAKELLNILDNLESLQGIAFYDDLNNDADFLFGKFPILKNEEQVKNHFKFNDNKYIIGIGNPLLRSKMYVKFNDVGGIISSCISPFSIIGKYDVSIGDGTAIMDNAILSNSVKVGIGCIIYYNAVITHDCLIEDFVEISPSANLLGHCRIGSYTQIGSNATILPGITIGKNVVVGAGSVVTKDIPDNVTVLGVPAKSIQQRKAN